MLRMVSGTKSLLTKYFLLLILLLLITIMLLVVAVVYFFPEFYESNTFYNPFTNEKIEAQIY